MVKRAWVCAFATTALAFATAPSACKPDLDDRLSIVSTLRVLAVRAEPAEAAPKAPVMFTALVVDASGRRDDASIDWAYCNDRKPLAELGPVSTSCMQRASDGLAELGTGSHVEAAAQETACRQFGPDVPQAKTGEPSGRPVDPDATGGYYQPLRVLLSTDNVDTFTLGRARLTCGLTGATSEQLADFKSRYRANANPAIDALTMAGGTVVASEGMGEPAVVAPGAHIALRVSWTECRDRTADCGGAETYAVFDLTTRSVVDHRESIRAAFFATGGAFVDDRVGRDANDTATFVDNGWEAPRGPGRVHLWVVLRDDRGGVGWQSYVVDVR